MDLLLYYRSLLDKVSLLLNGGLLLHEARVLEKVGIDRLLRTEILVLRTLEGRLKYARKKLKHFKNIPRTHDHNSPPYDERQTQSAKVLP